MTMKIHMYYNKEHCIYQVRNNIILRLIGLIEQKL